jgi:AcrR family transcriptional regulator
MTAATTPGPGAQRRQGKRTQEAIYQAAIKAFAERGYLGTSLRSLAAEVGLEVGSLYRHFPSKEDLLYNIIRTASDDFYARLTEAVARADADPVSRLRALIEETARYHALHRAQSFVGSVEIRELTRLHYKHVIKQRNMVESLYKSLIAECVQIGYFPAGTNISITANFLVSIGTNVASWYDPSGALTPEEVARMAADFGVPVGGRG